MPEWPSVVPTQAKVTGFDAMLKMYCPFCHQVQRKQFSEKIPRYTVYMNLI
jgi:hypothetical protein